MGRQRIYIDTSVISHLDAPDTPEKMADTLALWELIEAGKYDVVLSDIALDELEESKEPKRSFLLASVTKIRYELVNVDDAIIALASKFIDFGILREKSFDDCRHIATALISGCDIIASWNFKHMVNIKTIQGARKIAATDGYNDLIICTPTMLIDGGINDE